MNKNIAIFEQREIKTGFPGKHICDFENVIWYIRENRNRFLFRAKYFFSNNNQKKVRKPNKKHARTVVRTERIKQLTGPKAWITFYESFEIILTDQRRTKTGGRPFGDGPSKDGPPGGRPSEDGPPGGGLLAGGLLAGGLFAGGLLAGGLPGEGPSGDFLSGDFFSGNFQNSWFGKIGPSLPM